MAAIGGFPGQDRRHELAVYMEAMRPNETDPRMGDTTVSLKDLMLAAAAELRNAAATYAGSVAGFDTEARQKAGLSMECAARASSGERNILPDVMMMASDAYNREADAAKQMAESARLAAVRCERLAIELETRADSIVDGRPTVEITRGQLEAWAGGPLTDDEVARIDGALPNSSVPDCISDVAASVTGKD